MRQVTFTARQFRHFIYGPIGRSNAKTTNEFDVQLRLLRKLNDGALTKELPVTEEEAEAAEKQGTMAFPMRELLEDVATFMLDEDEWALLKHRLGKFVTNIPTIASTEFKEVLDRLDKAQTVEVKAPKG